MSFSTGLSALIANQTALRVTGNNIANASTPGYRRQEVLFVENPSYRFGTLEIGTGVSIGDIRSVGNAVLEASILQSTSEGSMLGSRLANARQLESLVLPGTGSLQERTNELFLNLQELSRRPSDSTMRSAVLHSANGLGEEISRVAAALQEIAAASAVEIDLTIADINEKAGKVHDIHRQIVEIENGGGDASSLRNRRDVMLKDLAQLIDVERRVSSDGTESFVMGGGMFSLDNGLRQMTLIRTESGSIEVWREGCDTPHQLGGGKLAGLLAESNEPGGTQDLLNQLTEFASALVSSLDTAHATGVGIGGSFTSLSGTRPIADPDATLAANETFVSVSAGRLFISVHDQQNGQTTLESIDIDPASQSLQNVASLISGIDHLTARVDSLGRLSIVADAGTRFDFTGSLQTVPDVSGVSGTTQPELRGRYRGDGNDEFSFTAIGGGTVGVTAGLQLEVRDKQGDLVKVVDVGTDYEPGSDINLGDGILLSLSSGSIADGDSFTAMFAGQPDETGMLAALGLNTLFEGNDATTLRVDTRIAENPSLLATTANAEPSDTFNLHRMISVQDALILRDGTTTLGQFLSDLVGNVGQEVGELNRDVAGNEERITILETELSAVSGVDVNEEIAMMLQYQRAYQAAGRYIATVDRVLQDLFTLIR